MAGLGSDGATLFAGIRGTKRTWLTNNKDMPGWAVFWVTPPVNSPDEPYARGQVEVPLGSHFPYGIDVLPDLPV